MPIRPRRIPLLRTVLVTSSVLVLATVASLVFLRVDRVVIARGELVGGSREVTCPLDARIERVLVRAGQSVRAGDALLVLESSALRNDRERAEAQVAALESRLEALETRRKHLSGVRHPRERQEAELALARAKLEAASSERQVEAYEALLSDGLMDRITVDAAKLRRDVAQVALREATLRMELLGPEQDAELALLAADIEESRSRLDDQRLAAAELARREALTTLVAPVDGVILDPMPERRTGHEVKAGQTLLSISTGRAEGFLGSVDDRGRTRVHEDMPVRLRVDGYPWMLHGSVRGRVRAVASSAAGDGYPIEVAFESGPELELFEGMTADARILVEEDVRVGELLLERLVGR